MSEARGTCAFVDVPHPVTSRCIHWKAVEELKPEPETFELRLTSEEIQEFRSFLKERKLAREAVLRKREVQALIAKAEEERREQRRKTYGY